jgi:hypothetical protein
VGGVERRVFCVREEGRGGGFYRPARSDGGVWAVASANGGAKGDVVGGGRSDVGGQTSAAEGASAGREKGSSGRVRCRAGGHPERACIGFYGLGTLGSFGPAAWSFLEREGEPRLGFWWVGVRPGGGAPAAAKKSGPATTCMLEGYFWREGRNRGKQYIWCKVVVLLDI